MLNYIACKSELYLNPWYQLVVASLLKYCLLDGETDLSFGINLYSKFKAPVFKYYDIFNNV